MPCRSTSDIVCTCTPNRLSRTFSPSSRLRTPTIATFFGLTLAPSPPISVSSAGPSPKSAATGMPWMLPDGEVSGVLMSPCASIQSSPTFLRSAFAALAIPETVPTEIEWSPPRTRGNRPRATRRSTLVESWRDARAISRRNRARVSPTLSSSMFLMSRSPSSATVWPSSRRWSARPAMRIADGPMSTPRRPDPRSMGTPRMWTLKRCVVMAGIVTRYVGARGWRTS